MYTKNQMADGTVFYFNASLNKSVWKPPADAIIHEAVKLKTLQQDETSSSSSSSSASSGQQQASASTTGTTNTEILPAGTLQDYFFRSFHFANNKTIPPLLDQLYSHN